MSRFDQATLDALSSRAAYMFNAATSTRYSESIAESQASRSRKMERSMADENVFSYSSERDASQFVKELHGRAYNTLNDVYLLPDDETEWERLNKQHLALVPGLGGLTPCPEVVDAVLAPVDGEERHILDIGCGTGTWAIEMAKQYPHASIIGVDLAPTPLDLSLCPPNITFQIDDITQGLTHFHGQFDVVHAQCISGGIQRFEEMMEDIERCLKPGGIAIFVDGDRTIYSTDRLHSAKFPEEVPKEEGSWFKKVVREAWYDCNIGTGVCSDAMAQSLVVAMGYPPKYPRQEYATTPFNNLSSDSLEVLMARNQPIDLSGQVTLEVDRLVDGGGFGEVRLGYWNGKKVAVKILKTRRNSPKATMERRLKREMTVWAALNHPNIVQFNGYITKIGELPAMVSTWCENGDATKYLEANPHITIQTRFRLAQDVADGLAYLHSLKIVHGDLKLRNVLIDDNGTAQLCDFGLVRLVEWQGSHGLTTTSPYGGTWKYNAYELWSSKKNPNVLPTFESDIYALGCVTYEFIYLRQPFHGLEIVDLVGAIKDREPPASRPHDLEHNRSICYLWDLLESCWNPDPKRRPNAKNVVLGLNKIDGDI